MKLDQHDIARFWSKVLVTDEGSCWLWTASVDQAGYGEFKLRVSDACCGAHRLAYALFGELSVEDIGGLVVRHSCDNPTCCNPFHLSTGAHADNVVDRVRRGRSAIGSGNGNHKLVEAEVVSIRADQRANAVIARQYGVHVDTIRMIKIGKTWRHLLTADNDNDPLATLDPAPELAPEPKI